MTRSNDENQVRPHDDVKGSDLDEQVADYLAGEMTQTQRAAFEARLSTDPQLAQRVGSLQTTARLIDHSLSIPGPEVKSSANVSASPQPVAGRIWFVTLRYAALIGVAFGAGLAAAPVLRQQPPLAHHPVENHPLTQPYSDRPDPDQLQSLAKLNVNSGLVQNLTSLAAN